MTAELDFALDDLDPADLGSEQAESLLWVGDLTVLAEHHTAPHRSHSYVVAHDTSATWGVPGSPQIAAIKVARDFNLGTFTLESEYHASVPFAQAWLIERGCPPEKIALAESDFVAPADEQTLRVQQMIRDGGQRYYVIDTWTSDFDPCENWTLARDSGAAVDPVRVFLEVVDEKALTYTVREGAFLDEDAARDWLEDRSTPLPPAPEAHLDADALRTRVALARSTGTPHATACGLDTLPLPSTSAVQQPSPGRSR
ncbi:glycosyl hydrolase [Streptomyces sp. V4-01]|uniref:Glycosyl hydrolase n=1 Tax=Actinacidiphila polyblastidii TaxID=3110430 RepID=A0ABU7PCV2_9ACTN|nr:glycosyl hydrolase [Streptomyces sp. V4-01]